MISFGIKYWGIFLILFLVAALGATMMLYFKNRENKELTKSQVRVLTVLRFLSVFLIAFLLLSPFLRNLKKIVQNPIIITAWDNSGSMTTVSDSVQVKKQIESLRNVLNENLGKKYSLAEYTFGGQTTRNGSIDFSDKNSDYSELITSVNNNFFNDNVGALIIAGDGILNRGKNPVNLVNSINFPIYTIGLGDTTEIADARIENIRYNRTAFKGNRFPVEVDVYFLKQKGKPLKLTIRDENEEMASTVITPPNDDYFSTQEFILDADLPGLKHYTVNIQSSENERNNKNNTSAFVIQILENKQKILILSDGPHPDVGAIKNTLDLQQSYDVSVFTEDPYPSDLEDFNLLILNQLPTNGKSASAIIERAQSNRIPILFIVGNKTFIPQFNALKQGAEIDPLAGSAEEVQAIMNPSFRTFTLSEDFKDLILKFPPLYSPFANFELDPEFSTLFYQKINNIETNRPLLAIGNLNGRKTGFVFGEGIWRWRLYNYYLEQNENGFNEIINQLVQYLALRENEDNFILDYKPVFTETEDVTFDAEVYNEAYEKITSEEVNMVIRNTKEEEFNFTFDVQGDDYHLNAGHLLTGDYNFTAEVTVGNESFTEDGSFAVTLVGIEDVSTRANHRLLYQLAEQSGGDFYLPNKITSLIESLENNTQVKPVSYFQKMVNEIINLRWIFFVLLLLLTVEWFLRKYWGIY